MHKFQHLVPWRKLIGSKQNQLKELVMFNPNGSGQIKKEENEIYKSF